MYFIELGYLLNCFHFFYDQVFIIFIAMLLTTLSFTHYLGVKKARNYQAKILIRSKIVWFGVIIAQMSPVNRLDV